MAPRRIQRYGTNPNPSRKKCDRRNAVSGQTRPEHTHAMRNDLFAAALGLSEPWCVKALSFDESGRQLTIQVGFRRGSRFAHSDAVTQFTTRWSSGIAT